MKMIEKIKATKKKLHEDEVKAIRQEKFKRKASRRSFKPGKQRTNHNKRQKVHDEKSKPKKQRKISKKKVHGKNSLFNQEY